MNTLDLLRDQLEDAHSTLEGTMADVTEEQLYWTPLGIAVPLGATYAHIVFGEDTQVNRILRGVEPLLATSFSGKTGLSELPPHAGEDFRQWAADLRVDFPALRAYGQAAHQNTKDYLAGLSQAELDREIDLSGFGLGSKSVSWLLGCVVVTHINNHLGELSCLKGLQGAKGYPF